MSTMFNGLADRLAELAEADLDDPTRLPPGAELWRRGWRAQRRQRAGALVAAAAAVVVLLVATVAGLPQLHRQSAAPAGSPSGMPDHVYAPSPWLAGTAQDGPLGPLAMIVPASRDSLFHTHPAYVGISVTGEYRFLDLPGLATDGSIALSPDGHHIAYYAGAGGMITRLAVYDTSTGRVRSAPIAGQPDPGSLTWAGDTTVVGAAGAGLGPGTAVLVWSLDQAVPHTIHVAGNDVIGAGPGGIIVRARNRRAQLEVVDPATGDTVRALSAFPGGPVPVPLDPTGMRAVLAGVVNHQQLFVLDAAGRHAVPSAPQTTLALGWIDEAHVAVRTFSDTGSMIVSIDVDTGARRTVSTFPQTAPVLAGTVATDLLTQPSVPGRRPGASPDQRGLLIAGLGIVSCVILPAFLWWRRRASI